MKQFIKRISAGGMALLLALSLLLQPVPALAGDQRESPLRAGYDVATVHYTDDSGAEQSLPFTKTASGYIYTLPEGVDEEKVTVEYFSTTRWDGAVDISWYNDNDTEFTLTTPAQLAGLAALVAGQVSAETSRWRVKGDISLLTCEKVENYLLVGAGGGNETGTVYFGSARYDFADKVIKLACDMDMGGEKSANGTWSGPNWTPIGGRYVMDITVKDPTKEAQALLSESYFNGTLDGQGHRILNLYCDRYTALGYGYSQGIGLVGYIGHLYDDEATPQTAPAVRNLSVSGSLYGRRTVAGVVGRTGDIPTGVLVENCANHASVLGTDSKGVGGVVAAGWGEGYIVNCYNTGSVSSTYNCPAGGICGNNRGMNIYACYSVGTVESSGNRGRGIGGHDSGVYTVANCYYLAGSGNDTANGGWYRGGGVQCTIDVTAMSRSQMQSQDLVDRLNANGGAYVYQGGSYPILFWEKADYKTAEHQVTLRDTNAITITASAQGTVSNGAILYFDYTDTPGYALRYFTANGEKLVGNYCTVMEDTVISAVSESLRPGTILIPESEVYTITVTKTGVIQENGESKSVQDYPVHNGDLIYEGDVFTAKAALKDGVAPEDPDYCYTGVFNYTYTYQEEGGASNTSRHGTFTATNSQATLKLTAQSETTHKLWSMAADTDWYNSTDTEFTLTTACELAGLAVLVKQGNSFAGKTIRLGADLQLLRYDEGKPWWDGIGRAEDSAFSGTFDGNGHTISQMQAYSADGSSYAALFLATKGATIENLTVIGSATADSGLAGIVSQATDTTIRNCTTRVNLTGAADGSGKSGGIAGKLSGNSLVVNCVNYGTVFDSLPVGGLVGTAGSGVTVQDCVNFGAVSGTGAGAGLGGLVGQLSSAQLLRCANYGSVRAVRSLYTGGLVGMMTGTTSSITDCYNAAAVTGDATSAASATGGLVGLFFTGSLANSFNCGSVSLGQGAQSTTLGGVIGKDMRKSSARIENVYYLASTCEFASTSGADERISAVRAEELASEDFLTRLDTNGSFVLGRGQHPELWLAVEHLASCGDLDGDGEITVCDLLLLRRYLAGGYDDTIIVDAADVNRDGVVNTEDLILLRKYLAGGYGVIMGERN